MCFHAFYTKVSFIGYFSDKYACLSKNWSILSDYSELTSVSFKNNFAFSIH